MSILTPEQIEYFRNNKSAITQDLLDALRSKGNDGKQLALDILDTDKDDEEYHLDAYSNRISFNGFRFLKKCYTKMNLSKIHLEEIKRCAKDLHYFKDNYIKIKTRSGVNFPDIREYQNDFLNVLNSDEENIVTLLSRQAGKSITVGIYLTWLYCFKTDVTIGICANECDLAAEFLNNVKNMLIELPLWMVQGTKVWNVKSICNESDNRILTDSPSSDSFRGFTLNVLVVDELAFIPQHKWNDMADSVFPTMSRKSWKKNILISTANGMNHFYEIVKRAKMHKVLKEQEPSELVQLESGETMPLEEYYKLKFEGKSIEAKDIKGAEGESE